MSFTYPYSLQDVNASCPFGGSFSTCSGRSTNFVGCCRASNACSSLCPSNALLPASFDPSYYGLFEDQTCSSGAAWYTCASTDPPFMGCCASNPCNGNGCPAHDLRPGFVQGATALTSATTTASSTTSSTSSRDSSSSTTSSISTAMTTAAAASSMSVDSDSSPTQSPLPDPSDAHHRSTIVGASVGAAAALILLLALLAWCVQRGTAKSRRFNDLTRTSRLGEGIQVVPGQRVDCEKKWSTSRNARVSKGMANPLAELPHDSKKNYELSYDDSETPTPVTAYSWPSSRQVPLNTTVPSTSTFSPLPRPYETAHHRDHSSPGPQSQQQQQQSTINLPSETHNHHRHPSIITLPSSPPPSRTSLGFLPSPTTPPPPLPLPKPPTPPSAALRPSSRHEQHLSYIGPPRLPPDARLLEIWAELADENERRTLSRETLTSERGR